MRRGTHHGSASGGVRFSGGWAGGARLPPPPCRRSVSPGLAAGQLAQRPRLRPSARSLARSGAQAAGPRQGGPRRPPAPPRPAWDPSRDAPSVSSLASAPLAVRCQPAPPRPAPHPPRTAQPRTPRVSRVFSLCGISSALALDAAEVSRLGPRLSSGQKPSSISKTHDASPSGPWPGLARSWGPDPLICSGSL